MTMKITKAEVEQINMNSIADKILNWSQLLINDKPYRICEIEFYVKNAKHNDQYTHCNSDQLEYEKFYFHKYHNGTYKSGTYKGLDITFGSKNENSYFGILIRSVYDEENNEFIEGPCRTVNKILELNKCDNISELLDNKKIIGIFESPKLQLKYVDNLERKEINIGPRIGLSDKYPEYHKKKYRFVIYKDKIKKERKLLEKIN